nr:MAG TPA: hypothetical protein [Caudoviricetes sp.]
MVKEKLKELIKEYKYIGDELSQQELKHYDLVNEGKTQEALTVGNKADELNKQLENKYDEIMEFIEENV